MAQAKVTEFRRALLARFIQAEELGKSHIEIGCGGLHDEVNLGGNKPAVCSGVMWVETAEGKLRDRVHATRRRRTQPDDPLRAAAPAISVRVISVRDRSSVWRGSCAPSHWFNGCGKQVGSGRNGIAA